MSQLRHFGTIRGGEEVVIIGYNKGTNACLVCRPNTLPQDEAASLRQIASSTTAQNLDYLVPLLRNEVHKSQQDWFTHLCTRMQRNDGAVISLPLKEIETMNDGQKAFYKGYGAAVEPKGGPSRRVGTDQEFRTPIANENDEIVAATPITEKQEAVNLEQARAQGLVSPTPRNDPEMARAAAQAAGVDNNAAMLAALTTLAESQASMAASMAELSKKMKAPTARKTPTRKPRKSAPSVDTASDNASA
jgi:hypothetical protein